MVAEEEEGDDADADDDDDGGNPAFVVEMTGGDRVGPGRGGNGSDERSYASAGSCRITSIARMTLIITSACSTTTTDEDDEVARSVDFIISRRISKSCLSSTST